LAVTVANLRRHRRQHAASGETGTGWSLATSLVALGVATAATALVSEILVHSLDAFAKAAGLSEFFVSAVVVAIVGNAAEHGGAIVIARRGNVRLATEIAVSSSAQVAVFLIPAVALVAWAIHPLALGFRPVELAAVGGSALRVSVLLRKGHCDR